MKFEPRPFQNAAIDHAVEFFRTAERGQKMLYAAPTGTGKSVIEAEVKKRLGPGTWLISPTDDIIDGIMDKMQLPEGCEPNDYEISTPVKLRNRLLDGRIMSPERYIIDESHHHEAETYKQLDLLSGLAPAVGYTATPYRGSPKSTRFFRETWGEPLWLITYREAVDMKYISMPSFEVLPLVDDDIVEVKGGEFDVTSLDGVTTDRLGDLADHCTKWYDRTTMRWDRPTIFSMPTSLCCQRFQEELAKRGIPLAIVASGTPKSQRKPIFQAVEACVMALAHINIVSEGVDLKLRRMVDVQPTMSPVKWVQQIGRITRPWEHGVPEYICTNRNIIRHSYALDGVVPISAVADSEKLFGPSQSGRHNSRALGMEAIGRFKPSITKLISGANLYVYSMSAVHGPVVVQYCCLVHPCRAPVWASRVDTVENNVRIYGRWNLCPEEPTDIRGYASTSSKNPTEKQMRWWERAAHRFELDSSQPCDKKSFQALPVLSDIGGWPDA